MLAEEVVLRNPLLSCSLVLLLPCAVFAKATGAKDPVTEASMGSAHRACMSECKIINNNHFSCLDKCAIYAEGKGRAPGKGAGRKRTAEVVPAPAAGAPGTAP